MLCAGECPVCLNKLDSGCDAQPCALACPNGHHVCIECVRVLIRPGGKQRTRLCYRCPCCRAVAGLTPYHMMVVVKGSWRKARQVFEEEQEVRELVGFVRKMSFCLRTI